MRKIETYCDICGKKISTTYIKPAKKRKIPRKRKREGPLDFPLMYHSIDLCKNCRNKPAILKVASKLMELEKKENALNKSFSDCCIERKELREKLITKIIKQEI